jgi:hypothetical protein
MATCAGSFSAQYPVWLLFLELGSENLPPQAHATCFRQCRVARSDERQAQARANVRGIRAIPYNNTTHNVPKHLVYVAASKTCETKRLNKKACNVRISYLRGMETHEVSPVLPLVDAHGAMARLCVVKLAEHLEEQLFAALAIHTHAVAVCRM